MTKNTTTEQILIKEIYNMISSNDINEENIKDILLITKGAFQSNNININHITNILQKIINQSIWNKTINDYLLLNLFYFFKLVKHQNKTNEKYERKFLLLLEFYLLKDLSLIRSEQIEMLIFVIKELLSEKEEIKSFTFGFIYLKLIDISKKNNTYLNFKDDLNNIKSTLLLKLSSDDGISKLKKLIL